MYIVELTFKSNLLRQLSVCLCVLLGRTNINRSKNISNCSNSWDALKRLCHLCFDLYICLVN